MDQPCVSSACLAKTVRLQRVSPNCLSTASLLTQTAQNPGILGIPIAVSAQEVNYNLPGVPDLRLSGGVLAAIYQGSVTRWDDRAIRELNPGVAMPGTPIVPIRRADASGDTFSFTSLLSATSSVWRKGPAFGPTVTWPSVPHELAATSNQDMVARCRMTAGCIAYVGVSERSDASSPSDPTAVRLQEARLQNRAGHFVHPTNDSIAAALASAPALPADLRGSLIDTPGVRSYPIVNYEYLMVNTLQPNADTALATHSFLAWAIDPPDRTASSERLRSVGFVPLPPAVLPRVRAAIARIGP